MSLNEKQYNIGWVPYLNLFPMLIEFNRVIKNQNIEIIQQHPTSINSQFKLGQLTLSPCSSITLLDHGLDAMIGSVGIAATSEVGSVYLGIPCVSGDSILDQILTKNKLLYELFKQSQAGNCLNIEKSAQAFWKKAASLSVISENIPKIRFTPQSATSVGLSQVLMSLWFGADYQHKETPQGQCWDLLIGDDALRSRHKYYDIIDLGKVWHDIFRLPFVYAVWLQNNAPKYLIDKLLSSAEIAEIKMHIDPCAYYNLLSKDKMNIFNCENLVKYWKNIRYRLKADDIKALNLFLHLKILSRNSFNQPNTFNSLKKPSFDKNTTYLGI